VASPLVRHFFEYRPIGRGERKEIELYIPYKQNYQLGIKAVRIPKPYLSLVIQAQCLLENEEEYVQNRFRTHTACKCLHEYGSACMADF
jgi:hypothetical protein